MKRYIVKTHTNRKFLCGNIDWYIVVDTHTQTDCYEYKNELWAKEHCDHLNKFEEAEKFIVCKDKNSVYWVFVKSIARYMNNISNTVKSDDGLYYVRQPKSPIYKNHANLFTGCVDLNSAKKLKQELCKIDAIEDNKYKFEIIKED